MLRTVLLTLLVSPFISSAQNFTDSNLPIVLVETDGQADIPDDVKIGADCKIIFRPDGSRNYLTDQNNTNYLNYNGRIGIELRGSSSQDLDKKPYGFVTRQDDNVTDTNVALLNMPKEHDWILNSLAFDPALMRDHLSYELARSLGGYATRTVFCEVVINGDYKGLYLLSEKIKVDQHRVDIRRMAATDNNGTNLTGGYITKCDKTTGGDPVAWQMNATSGGTCDFLHHYPKPADITTQQDTYIYDYFQELAQQAQQNNVSVTTGWPSLIDVPTFVDFMIMNEISSNADGYQLSTYFHKDKAGKLRAGPIWDFNLTFGNDLFIYGYDRSHTDIWQFDDNDNTGAVFWKDLYDSPQFHCYLAKRWNELVQQGAPLNYTTVAALVNQIRDHIAEAAARNNTRWGINDSFSGAVTDLKQWLQQRISWLNTHMGTFTACTNVTVPELVISRIHYHPLPMGQVAADHYEFIEITNNSNATVNAGGFYFRDLGISYVFPAGSTLQPHQVIILASDAAAFQTAHGFAPYGEFARNLSDQSQHLLLADAFGNTIDEVTFEDQLPWPNADGNGKHLKLISLDLDNALASSWVDDDGVLGITEHSEAALAVRVFPNPAVNYVYIEGLPESVGELLVTNVVGETVATYHTNGSDVLKLDLSALPGNTYFLQMQAGDNLPVVRKLVIVH